MADDGCFIPAMLFGLCFGCIYQDERSHFYSADQRCKMKIIWHTLGQ